MDIRRVQLVEHLVKDVYKRQEYFCYLTRELAPRILELNAAGGKTPKTSLWCAGVDIGACLLYTSRCV